MKDRDLDRVFSTEEDLVPSSGFAQSVMDAVHREASAPPPIPFPWRRALPGLVLSVLSVVAVCVWAFLRTPAEHVREAPGPSILTRLSSELGGLLSAANSGGLGWILLALLLTLASVTLSLRFVRRRM